ncbi:MAG: hypothetical protein R3B07_18680 [Polyangiaceae bacterium]
MRTQLWIPVCCLSVGLLVACTAKERDKNVANGGSAGQGAEGGTAGVGAEGGTAGATGGTGAQGGSAGMGGTGAQGGDAGAGGSAGATGGAGGTGGQMQSCSAGPVVELRDPNDTLTTEEPDVVITRCDDLAMVARTSDLGLEIYQVRMGSSGSPIENRYVWPTAVSPRIVAATCDVNKYTLMTVEATDLTELSFPRSGQDLATPLNPTPTKHALPPECRSAVGDPHATFVNGEFHVAFQCDVNNMRNVYVGFPIQQVYSGAQTSENSIDSYAYSGGIHLLLNEAGQGWAGATPAQLGQLQQLNFEDPITRPTGLAMTASSSAGFMMVGITTHPPPTLTPARLFTGQVAPNNVDGLFVGGSLPATIKQRMEITNPQQLGPTSALAVGPNTAVFSLINQSNALLMNVMDKTGEFLVWGFSVYQPADATLRRSYAETNPLGIGNVVVWAEFDANNIYTIRARSLLCL